MVVCIIVIALLLIALVLHFLDLRSKWSKVYYRGAAVAITLLVFYMMFTHTGTVYGGRGEPTAMDVYAGKTTLRYTIQDGTRIDSVVVWKDAEEEPISTVEEPEQTLSRDDTILAQAVAISIIETKCNNIKSSNGLFCGYLQISESMVREANRILGYKCYHTDGYVDDRMDWSGSLAIMSTILEEHNPGLNIDRTLDIWNKYYPVHYRKAIKNCYEFLVSEVLPMIYAE